MFALLLDLVLRPFTKYFTILRDIGSGTFGTVLIAKHKINKHIYAAKFIKKKGIKQFVKSNSGHGYIPLEIFMLAKLSHPNIINIYEYNKLQHHWVYTMEYSEDTVDLRHYTREQGRLSEMFGRYIFLQVHSAVTYCFRNGVDHRDVKDQNILINKSSHRVKLIDFGGASFCDRDTVYTKIYGTEAYLPPEAFTVQRYSPTEGAVWGLGCLLYCMLCGTAPFRSKREVVELEVLYPTYLSSECVDFIRKCLTKERLGRMVYGELKKHGWIMGLHDYDYSKRGFTA